MIRIAGITIHDKNRIAYGITKIYGIGHYRAKVILKSVGISPNTRVKDLSDEAVRKIQFYIDKNFKIEGNLRLEVNGNIKRLKEIRLYRGIRHIHGLPVRGQRTRSNARTKRGRRQTVGARSKEAWAKVDQTRPSSK